MTILKTDEELDRDTERILRGEEPLEGSANEVRDVPEGFRKWLEKNHVRYVYAKSVPQFVIENGTFIQDSLSAVNMGKGRVCSAVKLDGVIEAAKGKDIEAYEVRLLSKHLSDEEIITKIGGIDTTDGSCSSLAFSYIGNKFGYDVVDMRGGASRDFFSDDDNIKQIISKVGGIVTVNGNEINEGKKLLSKMKEGKEYYFGCGEHSAIVRVINKEKQFLELQKRKNGFKLLDDDVLKNRFGAINKKKSDRLNFLADIELFRNDENFLDMLQYINSNRIKKR